MSHVFCVAKCLNNRNHFILDFILDISWVITLRLVIGRQPPAFSVSVQEGMTVTSYNQIKLRYVLGQLNVNFIARMSKSYDNTYTFIF